MAVRLFAGRLIRFRLFQQHRQFYGEVGLPLTPVGDTAVFFLESGNDGYHRNYAVYRVF